MTNFLLAFFTSCIMLYLYHMFCPLRRIYCNNEDWQPIETLPEKTDYYLLITDGKKVMPTILPDFNRNGKCILGFYGEEATHWRKMPYPPK